MKVLKFALLAIMFAGVASAQTVNLKIASDSSSGTYAKMLGEVVNACGSDEFNIQSAGNKGGAVGNLDALFNNQADAAFLHSDVFVASSQSDPAYNRLKTLVALWPEPIHVLTLRVSKTKKQGAFSFGTVEINSLVDTAGYNVGAAGGGVLTGKVLQYAGKFTTVDEGTGDNVINALNNGEIAAAIFVGAQPLPNIQKLGGTNQYKLVPVGESIANQVSNVYRPAKINYPGLTNGPIATLAPVAVLLTKSFQTPAKVNAQRALRACFTNHLAELQDTGSRNWSEVQAGDVGTLNNYLELPVTGTTRKK